MSRRAAPAPGGPQRECPCSTGFPYDACCGRFHRCEREAPDAVALMRSRYAAYALGEAEYLWRTLHPGHDDRARPRERCLQDLRRAMRTLRYRGLAILDSRAGSDEAQVLFAATVFEQGRDCSFVELSTFLLEPEGWRYFSGVGVPRSALPACLDGLTIAGFLAQHNPRGN